MDPSAKGRALEAVWVFQSLADGTETLKGDRLLVRLHHSQGQVSISAVQVHQADVLDRIDRQLRITGAQCR